MNANLGAKQVTNIRLVGQCVELLSYILIAATIFSAVITFGMLFGLRSEIEAHNPQLGAEMFQYGPFVWILLPYFIIGARACTGWFAKQGAGSSVVDQAKLVRYPFLITNMLAFFTGFSLWANLQS